MISLARNETVYLLLFMALLLGFAIGVFTTYWVMRRSRQPEWFKAIPPGSWVSVWPPTGDPQESPSQHYKDLTHYEFNERPK